MLLPADSQASTRASDEAAGGVCPFRLGSTAPEQGSQDLRLHRTLSKRLLMGRALQRAGHRHPPVPTPCTLGEPVRSLAKPVHAGPAA
jgi:hypothetical protein